MIFARKKKTQQVQRENSYVFTPPEPSRARARARKTENRKVEDLRRKARSQERLLKIARPVMYLALAVLAATLPVLSYRAILAVMATPHFSLKHIEVKGLSFMDQDGFLETAGIVPGTHIMNVSPRDLSKRISSLDWVRSVDVRRKLPDSLEIRLVERKPVAVLAAGDLYLLDDLGQPYSRLGTDQVPENLPVVSVEGIENLDPDTLNGVSPDGLLIEAAAIVTEYQALPLASAYPVEEINVDPVDGFRIWTSGGQVSFLMGHGPFGQKWERLDLILRDLASRGAQVKSVSFDVSGDPDRTVVTAGGLDSPGRRKPTLGPEMRQEFLP
jgi:cell division septal protein FtsQ